MRPDIVTTNTAARHTMAIAAALIALATALGAFGTHGLQPILTPQKFANFLLAVNYQFYNALGLLGLGIIRRSCDNSALRWSVRLVLLGLLLFCGSLYALSAGLPTWVAMAAPLGGSSLILAWLVAAFGLWRGTGSVNS